MPVWMSSAGGSFVLVCVCVCASVIYPMAFLWNCVVKENRWVSFFHCGISPLFFTFYFCYWRGQKSKKTKRETSRRVPHCGVVGRKCPSQRQCFFFFFLFPSSWRRWRRRRGRRHTQVPRLLYVPRVRQAGGQAGRQEPCGPGPGVAPYYLLTAGTTHNRQGIGCLYPNRTVQYST